jgi:hypothetical protein
MAAIAFDPLAYTHELEASGVPRDQAEVHAKAMTARFLHNFDALVTTDYLDTRLTEFELRLESKLDKRLAGLESDIDKRFGSLKSDMDARFASMDVRFERMDGKFSLIFWMLSLTIGCVVIPEVLRFLA